MMRRLAVLATLALAMTACGDDSGSTDPVAWAEKVCKSVEGNLGVLHQQPDVDPTNPQQAKESMTAYLQNIANALGGMIGGIRDAGAPPVDDGAAAVDKLTTTLDNAKKAIDGAKSQLEQTNVDDPAALGAALSKAGEDLATLGELQDPTAELESNQQLKEAFDKAETCRRLDAR
ncbi:MAG TPA: hypothetical protein VGX25_09965 [Actinophytocola sp.]|uniref:hypothetical protein n=1 Tax=Actinophytocola sp. TaxID=1872138 RepID=UPI002DDD0D7D|nr:hypothetical protein [Actinophytocola sp.]HEV2779714.1 hypothetical protein [Actinophytocola sp.]